MIESVTIAIVLLCSQQNSPFVHTVVGPIWSEKAAPVPPLRALVSADGFHTFWNPTGANAFAPVFAMHPISGERWDLPLTVFRKGTEVRVAVGRQADVFTRFPGSGDWKMSQESRGWAVASPTWSQVTFCIEDVTDGIRRSGLYTVDVANPTAQVTSTLFLAPEGVRIDDALLDGSHMTYFVRLANNQWHRVQPDGKSVITSLVGHVIALSTELDLAAVREGRGIALRKVSTGALNEMWTPELDSDVAIPVNAAFSGTALFASWDIPKSSPEPVDFGHGPMSRWINSELYRFETGKNTFSKIADKRLFGSSPDGSILLIGAPWTNTHLSMVWTKPARRQLVP